MSSSLRPPGLWPTSSSVHGVLQARILEWIATPFSRGSYPARDQTPVSCIAGRFFLICATREAQIDRYFLKRKKLDGMGREVGGGIGMGNTCKSMADSFQCMSKITTVL